MLEKCKVLPKYLLSVCAQGQATGCGKYKKGTYASTWQDKQLISFLLSTDMTL